MVSLGMLVEIVIGTETVIVVAAAAAAAAAAIVVKSLVAVVSRDYW